MAPIFTRVLFALLAAAGMVACTDASYGRLSDALCDDLPASLGNAGMTSPDESSAKQGLEEPGGAAPADQPLEALDMAPAVFVIDEFVTNSGQTTSF